MSAIRLKERWIVSVLGTLTSSNQSRYQGLVSIALYRQMH